MAIEGHLKEMDLSTLVQYACTEGHQARLRVQHAGESAYLFFCDGNLVHAELNEESGEEVFYRVLRWEDGEFRLESTVETPVQTITTPWSALLVNGLQRADEETWDQTEVHEEESEMPENIQDILKELGGQVPGFMTAAVVGMDGLGIADYTVSNADTEAVNAQMTLLVKLVDTTVTKLTGDEVEDYLLTTDNAYLLVRFLEDKQYYLGLVADKRNGKLGNMRLNSRLYGERVSKALPH